MRSAILALAILCLFPALGDGAMISETAQPKLAIQDIQSGGKLSVRIEGNRGETLRLWKQTNSWGASSWRIVVVRQGELKLFYQNPDQVFTRNFPAYAEYSANATFELDVNQPTWLSTSSQHFEFKPGDLVVVLYEVGPSPEAQKFHVWTGSLAAHLIFSKDSQKGASR